jgi:hypothetical protein
METFEENFQVLLGEFIEYTVSFLIEALLGNVSLSSVVA